MNIGYVAPLTATGYSQAARSYIKALHDAGAGVHVFITSEDPSQEFGEEGALMRELALTDKLPEDMDIIINHRQPDHVNWVKGIPNICYTVWEADLIPVRWAWIINDEAVEAWVPTQFDVEVFQRSGVTVPITKVPHIVDVEGFSKAWYPKKVDPRDFAGRKILFHMGPWDARKNPEDLIRSYYTAFSSSDDVILVMRSYVGQHSASAPATAVNKIRSEFQGKNLPPIEFLGANLPIEDINWLHQNAYIFVSMAHSEGWGLGHSQSLAVGVPVLAVKWGGAMEYQNEDNSFLVRVPGLVPTAGFPPNSLYDPNRMRWAFGDIEHASQLLREAYENPVLAAKKGLAGKKQVAEKYSHKAVGEIMMERLTAITKAHAH